MTERPAASGPARAACVVCALASVVSIAALTWAIVQRAAFPYPLEWQEAAMLEHIARDGTPYVAPGVAFAPFPYPPLFHWVGELLCGAFGASLPVLRTISIASTGAILVALCALGAAPARAVAGLVGAGVFAGAYGFGGTWYDVARVDMLSLALALFAYGVATSKALQRGSVAAAVLCGLLLAAAALGKQTMAALVVALPFALMFRSATRRAGLIAFGVASFTLVLVTAWLQRATDGAYWFTVVELLAGSPLYSPGLRGFWVEATPLMCVPVGLWLLAGRPRATSPVTPITVAMLFAIAWVGRSHEGGFDNTLIPAALGGALAIARSLGPALARRPWPSVLLVALLGVYLTYDPSQAVPTDGDRVAAEHIAARVDAVEGEVWQPGVALGHTSAGGIHRMAIVDLFKSGRTSEAQRVANELIDALDERRFAAIVLCEDLDEWAELGVAIGRNYRPAEHFPEPRYVCPTGAPIGPLALWVPR